MEFNRFWAMPSKDTFSIQPIREFVWKYVKPLNEDAIILDPFSGNSPFAEYCITNDLDSSKEAMHHMDAIEFLRKFENDSVEMVLFDPPYSVRQVSECYRSMNKTVNMETTQSTFWTNIKIEIARVVKPMDGMVLSFGWNSGGIGKSLGFKMNEIMLIAHGGVHNDTICTAEIKTRTPSEFVQKEFNFQ